MLNEIHTAERLVTPPSEEPITLDDVKAHVRFKSSVEDELFGAEAGVGWIAAARQFFEDETGRTLTTATYEYQLDAFPIGPIELPHPPLREVLSVTYLDGTGSLVAFADDSESPAVPRYDVQAPSGPTCQRGLVAPKVGQGWPAVTPRLGAVRIVYTAGYGTAADVPALIKTMLYMLVGHFHKFRSEVHETRNGLTNLTLGARSMIRAFVSRPVYKPYRETWWH